MTEPLVLSTVEAGVAVLTINRPAALNALNANVLLELEACVWAVLGLARSGGVGGKFRGGEGGCCCVRDVR